MATAFVCITTDPTAMVKVLEKVRAVKGVEEAEMVYGIYDIVAKAKADSISSLKKILNDRIRRIDNVLMAITVIVEKA